MHRTTEQHDPIEIEQLYRGLDAADAASAVSVILKLHGETCDIDCLYCYEKRKEAPGGARIDAGQVQHFAEVFAGRPLAVELHGGEPLTAGREHVAEVLRELAAQPSVVRVSMQTNGVFLDAQWLDLLDEECPGLQIGISLDGDAQGNAWRIGYDGKPVYPRVAAALRLLAERGRKGGVIAAVNPAALGRAEAVLDHLADFEAVNAVSFVPCFDTAVHRPTAASGRRLPASRQLQQAAVDLIHEAGHNWLNDALTATNCELGEEAVFYSPWRQMKRSAFGFLHACWAFPLTMIYTARVLSQASGAVHRFLTAYLDQQRALLAATTDDRSQALALSADPELRRRLHAVHTEARSL